MAVAVAMVAVVLVAEPRGARAGWRTLSGVLPAYADFDSFQVSPDSQRVVYVTDAATDDVDELYSVPVTGDAQPIKLNAPLVAGGNVRSFAFTPDGARVLYLADQDVVNRVELYTVPAGGGAAAKLNAPLVTGGNVVSFKVDPESGRVVYVADQQTNDVFELWSISGTGGGLFKLNGTLVAGGDVGIMALDPLSGRAVYSADQETDGKYELYSAPLTGGGATKLNPPIVLVGGGDAGLYSEFAINAIVPVVVFVARQADATGGRVYMVPTAGGTPTQLSFELLATQRILNFRISPTGDRVVFNVATRNMSTNAFKGNLYSALIGGGGTAALTAPPADPLYGASSFTFVPNGERVVYGFQQNAASTIHLQSSVVASGVRATLYAPSALQPQLASFIVSPDSQWVAYSDDTSGLFTIPTGGGSRVPHATGGPTGVGVILPDSSRILFRRSVGGAGETELISAQIFGGDERELSELGGVGYVGEVIPTPDSQFVVFVVQVELRYELRVSDGTENPWPTTTTTTTLPGGGSPEVCGNCVDDDGDGRVDLDDDACCGARGALTLMRAKLTGTRTGAVTLAMKASLDDASLVPGAAPAPGVQVQLAPDGGAPLVCALLPAERVKLKKGALRFRGQPPVDVAQGLDRLVLDRKKSGRGSLVVRGNAMPFALPAAGPLRLTIGTSAGGEGTGCRTVTNAYRATRKGLVAP